MFPYVFHQNKNDPEKIRCSLLKVVNHAFGMHDNCGKSWCSFLQNPQTYKHKGLPYGRDLCGEAMKVDFTNLFKVYAENAKNLAPLASTQLNENFNAMVAAKAPKSRHYSGSNTLNVCVSAAVHQKNMGQLYLCSVFRKAGLQNYTITQQLAKKFVEHAKKTKMKVSTITSKRRRGELTTKQRKNTTLEVLEGNMYQSGISLINAIDITEIPLPVTVPDEKNVSDGKYTLVSVDVETTSVQFSGAEGTSHFDSYIVPSQQIAPSTFTVSGLSVVGNQLLLHGKPVSTISSDSCLTNVLLGFKSLKGLFYCTDSMSNLTLKLFYDPVWQLIFVNCF